MDNKKTINEMLGVSLEKIKEMADVNSIIGDPITMADGTTIVPISKVSYGFASGGSDLPSKYDKELFGGGAGAGISIKPQGFLVITSDGDVKMVGMDASNDPISGVIGAIPGIVEKIKSFLAKKKGEDADDSENAADVVIND